MRVVHKDILMIGVDLDSLDESEDNHEAVEFDILLSQVPDPKWVEEFDIAYRGMPNVIKPPVHVVEDRFRVAFLPRYDDELQNFVEFLRGVMSRADEEVRKTEAIQKVGHLQEHVDKFRDSLRDINFAKV
jgi:hypothetical protein